MKLRNFCQYHGIPEGTKLAIANGRFVVIDDTATASTTTTAAWTSTIEPNMKTTKSLEYTTTGTPAATTDAAKDTATPMAATDPTATETSAGDAGEAKTVEQTDEFGIFSTSIQELKRDLK